MQALEWARSKQSAQTGFVHKGDLIPLFENLCFSLALFKTHTKEHALQGIQILERLLPFFSKGFPAALHEYPCPASPSYQIRCALPLFWILKNYAHVIASPLRDQINACFQELVDQKEEALSPPYQLLLQALHQKPLKKHLPQFSYEWGLLLLAYQIEGEISSWILEEAMKHWDPKLKTFCGKPFQEYQRELEPEFSLYDFFMLRHQEERAKRFERPHPVHLQTALIFPFSKKVSCISPAPLQTTEKSSFVEWNQQGHHLFRLIWGETESITSLVCQDPLTLQREGNDLLFIYPEEVPNEKERLELNFYVNRLPTTHITLDGKRQTLFYLGETVAIHTPEKTVSFVLSLEEGEGSFTGHLAQGNRPAQVALKSAEEMPGYDWRISVRSLCRSSRTAIRLRFL